MKRLFPLLAVFAVAVAIVPTILFLQGQTNSTQHASQQSTSIYYGVNPSAVSLETFVKDAGKQPAIVSGGLDWQAANGGMNPLPVSYLDNLRNSGYIPLFTWATDQECAATNYFDNHCQNQPRYQLQKIIRGDFDGYITQWAKEAAAWGKPFFLQLDFDINYSGNAWSEQSNGNSSGQFAQMWIHVVNILRANGATNATLVWTAAQEYPAGQNYPASIPLSELYPGDNFVDWVATNAVNVPPSGIGASYQPFSQILTQTYNDLQTLASSKPVMVINMMSPEVPAPNSKAGWITDALSQQLPSNFPNVRAFVWMNSRDNTYDFRIESSLAAQQAFASAVASPVYASNQYATLSQSPIPPPAYVVSTNPTAPQSNRGGNPQPQPPSNRGFGGFKVYPFVKTNNRRF